MSSPGAHSGSGASWVDRVLLAGPEAEIALVLDRPVSRGELRSLVEQRRSELEADGVGSGSTVALRLPPSLEYVATLLAAWQAGAQVTLLDHRLTAVEVEDVLTRLEHEFAVEPSDPLTATTRVFQPVTPVTRRRAGRPARTPHVLYQLSSGSTGPSKVIGRTRDSLVAEVERYTRIEGIPRTGERVVVLASILHVLGLVAGLLHSLHRRVELVIPERMTATSILKAIAAGSEPTTLIGVPFHAQLLAAAEQPPALPQFERAITAGEPLRDDLWGRFTQRYRATLGSMYGMTEAGVIATDIFGSHRPALAPAPGMTVRVVDGEVQLALSESPYVSEVDPTRWSDGWLRTRDGGAVDPGTGRLTVFGRLDSLVSIGGLKVDLNEVEITLKSLPGVSEAVVVYGGFIEAYLMVSDPGALPEVEHEIARRLAPYKRPRELRVLPALPRTPTGKLVRNPDALRAAARAAG